MNRLSTHKARHLATRQLELNPNFFQKAKTSPELYTHPQLEVMKWE